MKKELVQARDRECLKNVKLLMQNFCFSPSLLKFPLNIVILHQPPDSRLPELLFLKGHK